MGILGVIGVVIGTIMIVSNAADAFWYGRGITLILFVVGIILAVFGVGMGIAAIVKRSKN